MQFAGKLCSLRLSAACLAPHPGSCFTSHLQPNPAKLLAPLTYCSSSSSTAPDVIYDVVIVGGGMVGAALSALLRCNPLTAQMKVAVIDQKAQSSHFQPKEVPDIRVSTITPASIACIKKAGAWGSLAPPLSAAFAHMQVWDSAAPGHIRWSAHEAGVEDMGIVVENGLLQAALLAAAQRTSTNLGTSAVPTAGDSGSSSDIPSSTASSSSNSSSGNDIVSTEFIWPAEVQSVSLPASEPSTSPDVSTSSNTTAAVFQPKDSSGRPKQAAGSSALPAGALAEVALAGGRKLACRLVVAADGPSSKVRDLVGLRTFGWSYNQRGLVATVTTSEPNTTAWQRFLPTGPLALLPARDGYSNIVWSTTPEAAATLEKMNPQEFAAAVNRALQQAVPSPPSLPFGLRPEAMQLPPRVEGWAGGPPRSFPLQLKHAGKYVLPRLVLVGDAAHAVHPLAGQGVNLGLGDAEALAEALAAAKRTGSDIGDLAFLEDHYEQPRRAANLAMSAALDGLQRVFSVQSGPLAAMRGLGLQLINAAGPIKNQVMKYAMGI